MIKLVGISGPNQFLFGYLHLLVGGLGWRPPGIPCPYRQIAKASSWLAIDKIRRPLFQYALTISAPFTSDHFSLCWSGFGSFSWSKSKVNASTRYWSQRAPQPSDSPRLVRISDCFSRICLSASDELGYRYSICSLSTTAVTFSHPFPASLKASTIFG